MPQFTLVVHTRITVTAQNPEAAARRVSDLTDQAAALMEDSAPGEVIVHRSTLTDAAATTDREIWGDLEPCDQCDAAATPTARSNADAAGWRDPQAPVTPWPASDPWSAP